MYKAVTDHYDTTSHQEKKTSQPRPKLDDGAATTVLLDEQNIDSMADAADGLA